MNESKGVENEAVSNTICLGVPFQNKHFYEKGWDESVR